MKTVATSSGKRLTLGALLGKGGEGVVHHVEGDANLAAKLYTDGKALERRDKIGTMVAAGYHRLTDFVAFPVDSIVGPKGEFLGFTMRKVGSAKAIHELYGPGSRKSEFPHADFAFLVRAALNFARSVASIHQAGCVIGDINHSGVMVSQSAMITLIDSDSFQVTSGTKVYRCRVGVGEYTPPELQGQSLESVDRTLAHDGFGLAVVIFQLLFLGKHPYAGRYAGPEDMPLVKAIREGRYAYGTNRARFRMEPPPFAPAVSDLPHDVGAAFEKAFTCEPGRYASRPAASEWIRVLSDLESGLKTCFVQRSHVFPKGAGTCPWCRLEKASGVALFPLKPSATAGATQGNGSFDLAGMMAGIDRMPGIGGAPDPVSLAAANTVFKPSAAALSARWERRKVRAFGLVVAVGALLIMFNGFPLAFFGVILGAYLLFGDVATGSLKDDKRRLEGAWHAERDRWLREVGPERFEAKRKELRDLADEHRRLPGLERSKLDELERRKRDEQLRAHLESHRIARAKIKGIGDSRKATLRSFGVDTAWDVSWSSIRQVPGFGDAFTRSMLAWRSGIEARFVFNPSRPTDPSSIKRIKDEMTARRREIERTLRRGASDLDQIAARARAARSDPGKAFHEAYAAFRQAEVDAAT